MSPHRLAARGWRSVGCTGDGVAPSCLTGVGLWCVSRTIGYKLCVFGFADPPPTRVLSTRSPDLAGLALQVVAPFAAACRQFGWRSWFPGHWSECVRAPLSRFRRPRQRWFCGPVTWRGGGCVDDDMLGEHAFRIFRCSFTPFAQSALSATRTLPDQCAMWWCDLRRCDGESRELMRIRQRFARASAHCRSLCSLHMKPPPPPRHRLVTRA